MGRLDGVGIAGLAQHVGDIGFVLLQLVGVLALQVVVAVGQAQARLAHADDVDFRVLVVRADAQPEDRAAEAHVRPAHIGGHLGLGLDRGDGVQLRRKRGDVELFGGLLVHHGVVERLDLDVVALQVLFRGQAQHDGLGAGFRQVAQGDERAVGGLVGGDDDLLGRRAVDVVVEAVARLDRGVHAGQVDAPCAEALGDRRGGIVARRGGGVGRDEAVQAFQALHVAIGIEAAVGGVSRARRHGEQGRRAGQDFEKTHDVTPLWPAPEAPGRRLTIAARRLARGAAGKLKFQPTAPYPTFTKVKHEFLVRNRLCFLSPQGAPFSPVAGDKPRPRPYVGSWLFYGDRRACRHL